MGRDQKKVTGDVNEFRAVIKFLKEGDMVFFPSFIIHRSPRKSNTKNKTIISWNIDFEYILPDMVRQVNDS